MKLETFFEKFELFAEAPGAVAKLRELVRHLAVTGRLVAQDIREESGELLLSRVDAERLAAAKARLISPMKPLPAVSENELPFKLQDGWAAARLIELVMEIKTGPFGSSLHKSDYLLGGTPVINPASIKDGKIIPIDEMAISHETVKRLEAFKLCAGDIILARRGEMGRCAVVTKNEEGWLCGTGSLSLRMPHSTYAPYLAMLIGSPICRAYLGNASVGTTMQNLNQSILANMPVGIPSLAEQKRIVAKVDELMALCDELEAQQHEREAQRSKLARASLTRFAEAPTSANLTSLFHPSYDITPADLRKSILTLAVQGKLVSQDPNDEPAETLIARVIAEKKRLVQAQEIKSESPLDSISDNEALFSIPDSWTWLRAGDLCKPISSGSTPEQSVFHHLEGIPFLKVYNIRNQELDFDYKRQFVAVKHHDKQMKRSKLFPGDVIMNIVGPPLGKVAIIPDSFPEWNCNQAIAFFRPVLPGFSAYLYTFLKEGSFLKNIQLIGTAGQDNISVTKCKFIPVPIPPLAEQHRIVVKIEQMMALVYQLEAQIEKAKKTSAALLDAAIHELLNPREKAAVDRTGIGCHVVHMLADRKTFGRTALAKFAYLAETHVGLPFNGQYLREAAGPLDPWIYRFEEEAAREHWFTFENTSIRDGNRKIVYRKGDTLEAKASEAAAALPQAQRDELDHVLKLLGGKPTEDVEIIATLFAVWNDFLIDGQSPSDEDIVTDFRDQWHEKKQKFTAKSLHTWLDWMRRNGLVPTGRGPRTQQHSKLDLH